jgi:hypothetical protein
MTLEIIAVVLNDLGPLMSLSRLIEPVYRLA